jgi:sigma-B regulation protein RsbU (phosphoserine phosphatase)
MAKKKSIWERLRSFLKANISLVNIIAAALLAELVSGVMYYSAQDIIHKTVERLIDREMNALYLCIRNKLAKVEVTMDNMAWVVTDGLEEPEWMFDITQRMVKYNPSFWGSGIAFVPNYYSKEGQFYEPYAVRRGQDSIVSMQLGRDLTQEEYFRIPATQDKAHWSEPYLDNEGAQKIITTYSVPVHDEKNRTVAVVYADISLDWLDEIMEESKLYKSSQRFLATGKGHLLAGKDSVVFQNIFKHVENDLDKNGHFVFEDKHGDEHHVYYHPVGGNTDWVLICVLNDKDVFSKLTRIRANLLILVAAGLILIGFIVWRTSRNIKRLHKVNAEKERIGGELRVASEIQQNMLPHDLLQHDDMDIFGSLVPVREVGGDLYDYYIRDEKLFFCIGDVSGKGAPSAMVMSVIHSLFRAFSAHENNPARIMQAINEASCRGNDSNMFVTLFIGILDLPTGRLRYCVAGHDAPILMSNGKWTMLDVIPHLPVGVFDDMTYGAQETQMTPDSTIFLYTDGLTEAMNFKHKQFGIQRVEEVLAANSQLPPQQLLEAITKKVHEYVGDAEQSDDLTMLAIHYSPKHFESTLSETLLIKNDIHDVPKFGTFMKSVMEKLNIEKSLARQLRLAVEEAVVNVIDYAYPAGQEGDIEIQMMSDGKTLKTIIIDAGVAFDPTAKEKADTSLSVEDRQIGGLGILLVRELMDAINYERENGKNILTLIKNFSYNHEH